MDKYIHIKGTDLFCEPKPKVYCVGMHFRCYVSKYRGPRGEFAYKLAMIPLNRLSCGYRCESINEGGRCCDERWAEECHNAAGFEDFDNAFPANPINGGVYRLVCNSDGCDDWYWSFEYIEEEEAKSRAKEGFEKIRQAKLSRQKVSKGSNP